MITVETVKTFITALQSGDMEVAASSMTDDFTMSGFAPEVLNKGEFLAMQSALLAAIPDFSYNLDEVHEEGSEVHALIRTTGTHTQELALPMLGLRAIPATGLAIVLPQVPVTYQVEDARVARMQIASMPGGGLSGLLQQVGAELPVARRES